MEKLLFLVKKEVLDRLKRPEASNFYLFSPYRFGPFSEDLYDDLEFLRDNGFVDVKGEPGGETYTITHKGSGFLEAKLKKRLPPEVAEEVIRVTSKYAKLSIQDLIKYVYVRYPEYAVQSEIRGDILGKGL